MSMGEIAAEVGLARNSLYRYFPDKAHILLEWFRDELPRQAARSAERARRSTARPPSASAAGPSTSSTTPTSPSTS